MHRLPHRDPIPCPCAQVESLSRLLQPVETEVAQLRAQLAEVKAQFEEELERRKLPPRQEQAIEEFAKRSEVKRQATAKYVRDAHYCTQSSHAHRSRYVYLCHKTRQAA